MESHSQKIFVHDELLRILDHFHLTQHQRKPNRQGRLLDLLFTNKLAIVANLYTAAGKIRKNQEKYIIIKKADWDKIKHESSRFKDKFLEEYSKLV